MSTNEQRGAREQFIALTVGYTVVPDAEGWPMVPGKYGRIEWYCDGVDCHSCPLPGQFALAVYTDRRLIRGRLLGIPGVKAHQVGDTELRAVFLPDALPAVVRVIRARRRRQAATAAHLARFAFRPAVGASLATADASGQPLPSSEAPEEEAPRKIACRRHRPVWRLVCVNCNPEAPADPGALPPDWRRVRAGVLNRDGRRCKHCGTRERLSVHHIVPRPLGTHDPKNLITLCDDCHNAVEQPADVGAA